MRIAAEQDCFAHALRKEVVLALRYDANEARERLARPGRRRTAIHVGTSHERRYGPERDSHECGLAAAVRAKDGVELPGRDGERDVRKGVAFRTGIAVSNVGQLQQRGGGGIHAIVQRRSSSANTGTPINAVTTPTGSSRGATTVRASVSANASNARPLMKADGSN